MGLDVVEKVLHTYSIVLLCNIVSTRTRVLMKIRLPCLAKQVLQAKATVVAVDARGKWHMYRVHVWGEEAIQRLQACCNLTSWDQGSKLMQSPGALA